MASTFRLKIITPERIVLDTEVEQVSATAIDGQLSILPNHEPLVTALAIDAVVYKHNGTEESAAVIGGILEVGIVVPSGSTEPQTEVTILSDAAELGTEIDETRAKQAQERAAAMKMQKTENIDTYIAELALSKAIARIRAVEIARQRRKLHH